VEQQRLRVVHVDDDPDVRMIIRMIIDGEPDLEVVSCASAAEVRVVVENTRVDLLLIDVMMPVTDGPTLLAELRTRPALRDVPAVFVTAKAHQSDLESLHATTATDVIVKPFEATAFAASLRRYASARVV